MDFLQRGFWSGVMATSTMSLSMFKMFQHLPQNQKSPLPPANLTANLAQPVHDMLSYKHKPDLTLFSHYGYGVACGLAYSVLQKYVKAPASVKGGAFGFCVWAASYLGWIPALHLRSSAYKMPTERNTMMVLAHFIWGASLGVAEERLRNSAHQMLNEDKKLSYTRGFK